MRKLSPREKLELLAQSGVDYLPVKKLFPESGGLQAGEKDISLNSTYAGKKESMKEKDQEKKMLRISAEVAKCEKCRLHETRTKTVFGEGPVNPPLMLIGEGPGNDEDLEGRPFVGKAGQLMTKMLQSVNIKRSEVYIANIVKCRPPGNRNPKPDEISECIGYLKNQIELVKPSLLVTLGNVATHEFVDKKLGITKVRGKWFEYNGIPLMPVYHPSYVLRNYRVEIRKDVWEDFKSVRRKLESMGLLPPFIDNQ